MMKPPDRLNQIAHKLELQGYKLTKQRALILEVLLEEDKRYLTTEEIFLQIRSIYPPIGIATVYRTLELLSDLSMVRKINYNDKSTRFELRVDESEHLPPHLVCKDCGLIEKVDEDWLPELGLRLSREYGFRVLDYQLDFIGTYAACNEKLCKKQDRSVS